VLIDLLGLYYLFFNLVYLKFQREEVSKQVDYAITTADDFTVALKVFPKELN
jgi:hypothetical protein